MRVRVDALEDIQDSFSARLSALEERKQPLRPELEEKFDKIDAMLADSPVYRFGEYKIVWEGELIHVTDKAGTWTMNQAHPDIRPPWLTALLQHLKEQSHG